MKPVLNLATQSSQKPQKLALHCTPRPWRQLKRGFRWWTQLDALAGVGCCRTVAGRCGRKSAPRFTSTPSTPSLQGTIRAKNSPTLPCRSDEGIRQWSPGLSVFDVILTSPDILPRHPAGPSMRNLTSLVLVLAPASKHMQPLVLNRVDN